MGCGESKHAVSTENTLVSKSNSKRTNSIKNTTSENNFPVANDFKNGNVKENEILNEFKKEEPESRIENPGNEESFVKIEENEEKMEAVEVVKEDKEEETKNGNVKEEKKEQVGTKVLDSSSEVSSDHEETIESIIPDGISGNSEYHSPRAKHDVVEEKALINGEAAEPMTEKEDGLKVGEGQEVVPVKETEVSASAKTREGKIAAEKEKETAASPNDVKAN